MDNEVEMRGGGFKHHDMESDNGLNTSSEEDISELSEQSDGEESDSELSEQSDSEENDSESGQDIKYMKGFGDIKLVGDKIYEPKDSKLDLDFEDIEIDGDVYKLCGDVYKSGRHTLYIVKGMFSEECEDSNIDMGTDEIVDWGDGKCYKQ